MNTSPRPLIPCDMDRLLYSSKVYARDDARFYAACRCEVGLKDGSTLAAVNKFSAPNPSDVVAHRMVRDRAEWWTV